VALIIVFTVALEGDLVLVEMDKDAFDLFRAMMNLNKRLDPSNHHRVLKGGKGGSGGGKAKSSGGLGEGSKSKSIVVFKDDDAEKEEEIASDILS
jgi:hypothetical protein